jgi:phosphoglycolate phosphatase-like HAD superfamily hydrolase
VLLLFDIDGTLLLGATDAHRDALQGALREVYGIDARQARVVAPAGRTDGDIARAILLGAGISAERIDEGADDVRERTCLLHAERCDDDLSATVLPGIRGLLEGLSARADVVLSLLTGNYEPVARLKLRRAGIGHYFRNGQGAFGSDCEDRAALPAIARRRAGAAGRTYPRARTLVIGDTPCDIACARADRVRCIAVATGSYGIDELGDADWAVDDAPALGELLAELLSN